jgi:hypothetical protein
MRWSEIIIIYLAIGAPFGVHFVVQNQPVTRNRILKAIGIVLLFPLFAFRYLFNSKDVKSYTDEKLERAKRSLFAALYEIRMQTQVIKEKENVERLVYVIRENVEEYSGLARVCESLSETDTPSEHELEVFRIAGCKGDELKTAASCMHRRNVRQIKAHHNTARNDLLHALAEIEECANQDFLLMNSSDARQINESLLRLYANAVAVLSLIEDKKAVAVVTRLFDKTSARLRKVEADDDKQEVLGEEKCISTVRQPLVSASQQTTLTQG